MAFMLVKLFLFPVFRHKTRPAHRKYSPKEAALAPHRQNSAHHRPTRLLRPVYSASMRYDREMRHPQPEFSPPALIYREAPTKNVLLRICQMMQGIGADDAVKPLTGQLKR